MPYKKITSLDILKEDCKDQDKEYFIWFGYARSSKNIHYNSKEDLFHIHNEIDDTFQDVYSKDLVMETNIIKSIYEGMFYSYEWTDKKEEV